MGPTIKDVAKATGKSITTVSRALNGYSDVSPSTKAHIIKVAKGLGYVPNQSAKNLVRKKNNTLAIILSGLEKEGGKDNIVYSLLSGMYAFAETINHEVALFTTSTAKQKEKSYLQFCKEHNIGGAVLNGIRTDDPFFSELLQEDFPCVFIDVHMEGKRTCNISIDNKKASEEAVNHLISGGHRKIAMINGRKEATVSIEREKGYRAALSKGDILLNEDYIVYADYFEDKAYSVTLELLGRNPDITAFFCASDMMAIGTMKAVNDLGYRIPDDISVIGFDNIPLSEYTTPPLTTISQDFYTMGYEAGMQLDKLINNEKVPKNICSPYKFIIRESTRTI